MYGSIVSIAVFLFSSVICGIVWGVRLEGKVSLVDQKREDLKELINLRFDDMGRRLGRIEVALNGSLKRD